MGRKGQIYTVNSGENLAALAAEAVLREVGDNPLALSDVTLWVPSPRAALALKTAFMQKNGAGLLPNIRMMSFHEEDADIFRFEQEGLEEDETVTGLSRLMVLTQLVQLRDPHLSFTLALERATALAKIFHRLKNYDVSLDEITALVPMELAEHWEKNLDFFKIAFDFYPKWLTEQGKVDAADAAAKVVKAQIEHYQNNGLQHLTWAVGFSDSTPLGVSLMGEIINHEKGAIILPGLDLDMKVDAWDKLTATHPNSTMKRMLERLKLTRSDVEVMGPKQVRLKTKLWRCALAPSDEMYALDDEFSLPATAGLSLVEAKSNSEEADAIALLMRETLETKGKTCALISPDRSLAVRVESILKRWGVDVDDSAGIPLSTTSIGGLFKLVAEVVHERFRPLKLAELLYHPLVFAGVYEDFHKKRDVLDKLVLRGLKPKAGLVGLKKALNEKLEDPFVDTDEADLAFEIITHLEEIFEPLQPKKSEKKINAWVARHLEVVAKLLYRGEDDNGLHVFDEEAGQALIALLTQWQDASEELDAVNLKTYTDTLSSVMSTSAVRKRHSTHPRLFIWGPMESRMQAVDRVIVGAVNEGVWPREVSPDPWLNAKVAEKVGLPSKDIHVGMSAHDFISLVCGDEIYLTRTLKDSEGETIPSRFLSRLQAVVSEDVFTELQSRGSIWLKRAQQMRLSGEVQKQGAPCVEVDVKRRPSIWSASTVRDLMQCPFKAYVKKVLKLQKLDGYEVPPGAADKGQVVHKVLESFFVEVPKMPAPYSGDMQNEQSILEHLLKSADVAFEEIDGKGVRALWQRKFKEIAKAFAARVVEDSKNNRLFFAAEKEARVRITPKVELYAKADRLDKHGNDMTVLDYKTGMPPKPDDVISGKEPQMATEAIIASSGGYQRGVGLEGLEYWHVSGAKNSPMAVKDALGGKMEIAEFVESATQGVSELARVYTDDEKPYEAFPGGATADEKLGPCTFCDYAGVCRYKDWIGAHDTNS